MSIVDSAIYVGGKRVDSPSSLKETFQNLDEHGGMAWIGLYRPDASELRSVAHEFDLHHLAVEDAFEGHQRPKLERYGDTLFTVLRPARYIDSREEVEFGEIHIFTGKDFVVTVRRAESPDLGRVRRRLEAHPSLLDGGPESVLYAIFDQVVDEYAPVVAGMRNDIDEIENELFGDDEEVSRRIFDLSREVIDFQRATQPLVGILKSLQLGFDKYSVSEELQVRLRDVLDHAISVSEQVNSFRSILENALTVHATVVAQRQNEEMKRMTETALEQSEQTKKISSWAAIIFAPTLIAGVYGMNFENMPELAWPLGYPMAVSAMAAMAVTLYFVFKRNKWL
ncbi:magnesium and cobalt transport protein CorA [Haematomicrobium sanguinis]|uniref:magnesium and cobalt transport protein CorA n=1 Tax=Haematomicrobium sanguinis TaxID=479106 RepID=UPI00047B9EA0|nr:magnesium and cobalt transport protein CorA [Haematomicrobium sanguinis]